MICATSQNKPNTMLMSSDCVSGPALGRLAGLGVDTQGIVNPVCGFGVGSEASCGAGVVWGGQGSIRFF